MKNHNHQCLGGGEGRGGRGGHHLNVEICSVLAMANVQISKGEES